MNRYAGQGERLFVAALGLPALGGTMVRVKRANLVVEVDVAPALRREGNAVDPFRILLVEDEATLRQVIGRNLAALGYRVDEAVTASEAVDQAGRVRPDLLILDINLPDRTGWDVLRELRRRGMEIPVIVASAVRVNPARLSEFRPLAYLPKPFLLESLLRVVSEAAGVSE